MNARIAGGLLLFLGLLGAGCITWPGGVDLEEPIYPEFIREGQGSTIGVAVFSDETGLTSNQWGRRKVFLAVSGSLLGLVAYPWDLRLLWSPPEIGEGWKAPLVKYDETLAAAVAARLEEHGFKGVVVDPRKLEGIEANLPALCKAAADAGCKALYVVSYNEFTRFRYRTELRSHKGYVYHRIRILEGSALVPSVALFRVPGGERMLARSNVGERGDRYVSYFWAPLCTFGRQTPFDQAGRSVERFIKAVSGKEIVEAKERCADFIAERDFTIPPKAAEAEGPPEKGAEGTTPQKPPVEKPPEEKPPAEKPPAETPPPEKPPGEHPPEEKPPGEGTPGGGTPPEEGGSRG
jgi:hypothetical protein